LDYLLDSSLLKRAERGVEGGYIVTVKGWEKYRAPMGGEPGLCALAMSFHESLDEVYDLGIKVAIMADCQLPEPLRVDKEQHNDKICERILANIRRCQFMIADFTFQRPGVYFESGFALGLNRPVIWCCRDDHFDKLPESFDTRQYNHIKWSNPSDLRGQLADRIQATIAK
jgi:nucleoside 2-deoxyribosyltransferase